MVYMVFIQNYKYVSNFGTNQSTRCLFVRVYDNSKTEQTRGVILIYGPYIKIVDLDKMLA